MQNRVEAAARPVVLSVLNIQKCQQLLRLQQIRMRRGNLLQLDHRHVGIALSGVAQCEIVLADGLCYGIKCFLVLLRLLNIARSQVVRRHNAAADDPLAQPLDDVAALRVDES